MHCNGGCILVWLFSHIVLYGLVCRHACARSCMTLQTLALERTYENSCVTRPRSCMTRLCIHRVAFDLFLLNVSSRTGQHRSTHVWKSWDAQACTCTRMHETVASCIDAHHAQTLTHMRSGMTRAHASECVDEYIHSVCSNKG